MVLPPIHIRASFALRLTSSLVVHLEGALPSWAAAKIYLGFLVFEGFLAATMPGITSKVPPAPYSVSNIG
jgi:hypothetical protein